MDLMDFMDLINLIDITPKKILSAASHQLGLIL